MRKWKGLQQSADWARKWESVPWEFCPQQKPKRSTHRNTAAVTSEEKQRGWLPGLPAWKLAQRSLPRAIAEAKSQSHILQHTQHIRTGYKWWWITYALGKRKGLIANEQSGTELLCFIFAGTEIWILIRVNICSHESHKSLFWNSYPYGITVLLLIPQLPVHSPFSPKDLTPVTV